MGAISFTAFTIDNVVSKIVYKMNFLRWNKKHGKEIG